MFFKVLSYFHEVDVVIETKVRIDHNNSERVIRDFHLRSQKGLENVSQLGDNSLTVKKITASSNLNGTIRKDLYRFSAVSIVVRERHLIIESCGFQLPYKTTITFGTKTLQLKGFHVLKCMTKFLNINFLYKLRDHCDCCNLYPRRT